MTESLLTRAEDDDPEIPLDDEPEIPLDDPAPAPTEEAPNPGESLGATASAPNAGGSGTVIPFPVALERLPLAEVLPADFPLPTLAKFVPDVRLRVQADEATRYAMGIEVHGPEGLQAADLALTALRGAQKAITAHFEEPVSVANQLHKRLTGIRGEWLEPGEAAAKTVGRRIYAEQQRLQAIAAEERRKAQEEANRVAREEARRRAEEAEKAKAPAAVVENLQEQAKTAQAAPVMTPAAVTPPKLAGTTVAKKWTCTIAGTPRDAEQQPSVTELSEDQRAKVIELMRDVVEGREQLQCFELNWKYLSARARSDEAAFRIKNLEAYDAGSVRAKASRSR